MTRVDTTKDINLAQLGRELGGFPPMTAVAGAYVEVLDDSVTLAVLQAAVDAHIAKPEPPSPPPPPTRIQVLAQKPVLTPQETAEAIKLLLQALS